MASNIWKLRLTLLMSVQRLPLLTLLRSVLVAVVAVVGAVCLAATPFWADASAVSTAASDTILVSLVTLAAWLSAFFLSRNMFNPRDFAAFGQPSASLRYGLLTSSILTWPALLLFVWLLATVAMRISFWGAAAAGVASAVVTLVTVIMGVRVCAVVGSLVITNKNAPFYAGVGWLLAIAALPIALFFTIQFFQPELSREILDASIFLSWTPLGASVGAFGAAAAGEPLMSVARFGVSILTLLVLWIIWARLSQISLSQATRTEDVRYFRTGLGWFDRFPAKPWAVIGVRSMMYWVRDPRYRVGVIAIPIAAALIVGVLAIAGVDVEILVTVPIPVVLLLLGWSVHNDVSADSTALWSHVASGTTGSADRWGRVLPVFALGVPIALVGASASSALLSDWRMLPALIGLNVAVLCVSVGVSSVSSALLPYPVTRPGESPFSQPASAGNGGGFAQSVSMVVSLLLIVPAAWASWAAVANETFFSNFVALVIGLGIGFVVLFVGIRIGAKSFDASSPELLSISQTFD